MLKLMLFFYAFCPALLMASNFSDSNKLFDWAERAAPELFAPAGAASFEAGDYLARYYSKTHTYIGTKKNGEVYVYGEVFNGLLHVGIIADYVELDVDGDALVAELFKQGTSNVQAQLKGDVIAILADDLDGSRHQRFIVKLASGQTLLVAHNIDLAPRINDLSVNDSIEVFGEYEWNDKGGVMHWTHKDPAGEHINGWLLHKGVLYQ